MDNDWDRIWPSLAEIKVVSNPHNEVVTVCNMADDVRCIGVGTDAAVFQSVHQPKYAFKIYAEDKRDKVAIESSVYQTLGDVSYFPHCFATTEKGLVLSYEAGKTLYDCIVEGIHIPARVVDAVEEARDYIRSRGLNPRDIHLKNIILQDGQVKIIDVSEYQKTGDDFRWEHLQKAYKQYYHLIDGRAVPLWLVEAIRKRYNQQRRQSFSYDDFVKSILRFVYKLTKVE